MTVKNQLTDGTVVADKSGWAPIRYLADKWVYGNVLLVGDVANQNFKPFVEGIIPTIICGDQAGKTAAEFIRGKNSLNTAYPHRVRDKLGTFFSESDQLIPLLYELGTSSDAKDHLLRLALFANILCAQAWQHMGLRVKPGTDQIERDVERARTAIDCVAFLLNKLEAHVPESEAKRLKNLLTDLQINFVRIAKD